VSTCLAVLLAIGEVSIRAAPCLSLIALMVMDPGQRVMVGRVTAFLMLTVDGTFGWYNSSEMCWTIDIRHRTCTARWTHVVNCRIHLCHGEKRV